MVVCTCDTLVFALARIDLGSRNPFLRGWEAGPELESVFKIAWWGEREEGRERERREVK